MASMHAGDEDDKSEWPADTRQWAVAPNCSYGGVEEVLISLVRKTVHACEENRGAYRSQWPSGARGAMAAMPGIGHVTTSNCAMRGPGGTAGWQPQGAHRTLREKELVVVVREEDDAAGASPRGAGRGAAGWVFTYALSTGPVCPRARLTPPPFRR